MCHYYDKSNVTIMMSLVQLDTNQEEEEYAYMVPSKYCVFLLIICASTAHFSNTNTSLINQRALKHE